MYESHILTIATSETSCGMDEAAGKVFGAIGMHSDDCDSFIKAGVAFLNGFKDSADQAIEDIKQNEFVDEELIAKIELLIDEVKEVDVEIFKQLLKEDWEERHEDENEE